MRIDTPRWALPLLQPARYKGAHGGRGGGKSHFFAEAVVEAHLLDPNSKTVCIREIQKSLRHSVKALIEAKIEKLGVLSHFDIQRDLILNRHGGGLIIFQGMQDHTADSIKSLEDFDRAWIEEAQSISARSLSLLRPTIRKAGSEIWASWNPQNETDPIDRLLRADPPESSIVVRVNLHDNPFASAETWEEYEGDRERAKRKQAAGDRNAWADFEHIWHGEYAVLSGAQVLAGCYVVEAFEPSPDWDGPYFGADWGFATDPTVLIKCWLSGKTLYIEREAYGEQVETVDMPQFFDRIEGARQYIIRADNARPEMISHMRRHGFPGIRAADKWPGSVEDGIRFLRGLDDIIIHPRCKYTAEEARLWSYKTDRLTGDPLPQLAAGSDHCWDACIAHGEEVATHRGSIPIEQVRVGDWVETRRGLRQVLAAGLVHDDKPLFRLTTTGGKTLLATADHRVFVVDRGFIRMDAITRGDRVLTWEPSCNVSNASPMAASPGAATPIPPTAASANISAAHRTASGMGICTGKYGLTKLARFLMAGISITKTVIARTTASIISNVCRLPNTPPNMKCGADGATNLSPTSNASARSPKHGTARRRASPNIARLAHWLTAIFRASPSGVCIAARNSSPAKRGTRTAIAQTPANRPTAASPALTTRQGNAPAVGRTSLSTNTAKPAVAADIVLSVCATGKRSKVYDLMVDDAEEFFASGVLVHNCRYALAPIIRGRGSVSVVGGARRKFNR